MAVQPTWAAIGNSLSPCKLPSAAERGVWTQQKRLRSAQDHLCSAHSTAAAGVALAAALVVSRPGSQWVRRKNWRRRGGCRVELLGMRAAGDTIELFRQFGPEGDPFEIHTNEILGVGGQGTVYRCSRVKDPSKVFAVKAVPIWRLQNDPESSSKIAVFEREMEVIQRVQGHPNIASCIGCWDAGHPMGKDALPAMYKMMVVELVPGGSLSAFIASTGPLPEPIARSVFRQVLAGVKFMHSQRVLHRDLKCDNILVCSDELTIDSQVKLIDFGVARVIANSYGQSCVGTREIMAPEILCAKLMVAPPGYALCTSPPLTFESPQTRPPGFGLASARPDGTGALVNGIEDGGQGALQGVQDGWAVARVNGVSVSELPFLPDPEAPQLSSIVGLLQGLDKPFTVEFAELPKRQFTEAVDLWSMGCVLFKMLTGKSPFASEQDNINGQYAEESLSTCSPASRALVRALLTPVAAERATIEMVERSEWLAS